MTAILKNILITQIEKIGLANNKRILKLGSFRAFLIIAILMSFVTDTRAQKKIAIVSFYIDREVDFSLMQMFDDDSEQRIRNLTQDPEFKISPIITDFHDFVMTEIMPIAPFQIVDEDAILGSGYYQLLGSTIDSKETAFHQPYEGYLQLGEDFKDDFLTISEKQSADGVMTVSLTFYVRKNGLKTVIMAEVEMKVRNNEGKSAWRYIEFGLSKEGINTFAGFIVSNQDEVMPMFTAAVNRLKEKMKDNFEKRSSNATKKL